MNSVEECCSRAHTTMPPISFLTQPTKEIVHNSKLINYSVLISKATNQKKKGKELLEGEGIRCLHVYIANHVISTPRKDQCKSPNPC